MIQNITKAFRTVTALSAFVLMCPFAAPAQTVNNGSAGIIPSQSGAIPEYDLSQGEETHPLIRLTPDKPQIVHLDADARSIIVGNQQHLNAVLDSTRSMVLVPRDPGATHITVIGNDGSIIMERYVIIAGPAEKYIRVRRNCAPVASNGSGGGNSGPCAQTTVYYCPDMCHETKIMVSSLGQPTPPPPRPLTTPATAAASSPAAEAPAQTPAVEPAPETPAANPSQEH